MAQTAPIFAIDVIQDQIIGARSVAVGDIDGDGDLDLVVGQAEIQECDNYGYCYDPIGADGVLVFMSDGGQVPSFTRTDLTTSADGPIAVSIADLNGDTLPDIALASSDDSRVSWFENNGGSPDTFTEHIVTSGGASDIPGPLELIAHDINGDTLADLIVCGVEAVPPFGTARLGWYRNTGGAFAPFDQIASVPAVSADFDIGDLDGDTDADIVWAYGAGQPFYTSKVEAFINPGGQAPSFGAPVPAMNAQFGTPFQNPAQVAIARVGSDGDADIVMVGEVSGGTSRFFWVENAGTSPPTFGAINTVAFGGGSQFGFGRASGLVPTDLDGDGDTDFAMAGAGPWLSWLRNLGGTAPSFDEQVISDDTDMSTFGRAFSDLVSADLDDDGDTDLVTTARITQDSVAWWAQASATNVDTGVIYGRLCEALGAAAPTHTVIADEILFEIEPAIALSGAQTAESVGAIDRPLGTSTTLDGSSTLRAATGETLRVLGSMDVAPSASPTIQGGAISFEGSSSLSLGAGALLTCDAQGLSRIGGLLDLGVGADLASVNELRIGAIPVFLPVEAEPQPGPNSVSLPAGVSAGDIDGDGDTDFVAADDLLGAVAWYENVDPLPPIPHCIKGIDFTGDGEIDFCGDLFLNCDPEIPGQPYDPDWPVHVFDADGDGDLDIVEGGSCSTGATIHVNDGVVPPAFDVKIGLPVRPGDLYGRHEFCSADLNGDGAPDLVAAALEDDGVLWYPSPFTSVRTIDGNADAPRTVRPADIDRDGLVDIVAALRDDGQIVYYRNNGGADPTFTRRVVDTISDSFPLAADPADFDRDGRTDIVATFAGTEEVVWYRNLGGSPPAFERVVIDSGIAFAVDIAAADADGDGDKDVFVVSQAEQRVLWYETSCESPPSFTPAVAADGLFFPSDFFVTPLADDPSRADVVVTPLGFSFGTLRNVGPPTGAIGVADATISGPMYTLIESREIALGSAGAITAPPGGVVDIARSGSLTGRGTVLADLHAGGIVRPEPGQTLSVTGDYVQRGCAGAGVLEMVLDESGSFGVLNIDGAAEIDGALLVRPDPQSEFNATILSASQGLTGTFDIAYVTPALSGARFMTIAYDALRGPSGSVALGVASLVDEIDYGNPSEYSTNGTPTAAALGDLNSDSFIDLAVVVPDPSDPLSQPGQLVVLLNNGLNPDTSWAGFDPVVQITVPTGVNPRGVAIGDLDGAGGLDIAVTNASDDTLQVFTNDGEPTPVLALGATIPTGPGSEPRGVAIAELDHDPEAMNDILIALRGADSVLVLENQGMIGFVTCEIPTEPRPNSVDPFDDDDDGFADIFAVGHDTPASASVSAVFVLGGGVFSPPVNAPITDAPREVRLEDLNADGLTDIVTVNPDGDSVTVILADGSQTFRTPVDLPVGAFPTSISVLDADDDDDPDLAIVAGDGMGSRVVQILRNDSQSSGQLVFSDAENLSVGGEPALVLAGDVDLDTRDDIVTVDGGTGSPFGPTDEVGVLLSLNDASCPGDLTTTGTGEGQPGFGAPDGVTDLSDLLFYVNIWQADVNGPPGSPADVTTSGTTQGDPGFGVPDGETNLSDLLFYVNDWLMGRMECSG